MIADFIQRQSQESIQLPVARMCELVQLPRRSYYHLLGRAQPEGQYVELRDQIERVALEWPSYGYRPMTAELGRRGLRANRKLALRLMREDNRLCLRKRPFVGTTDSRHDLPVYANPGKDRTLKYEEVYM